MSGYNVVGRLYPSSAWALVKIVVFFFVARLGYKLVNRIRFTIQQRTNYKDIPSLPRHWIWGNLVNVGERLAPGLNRHPDYGFEETWELLDRPSCFLVDLAPVDRSFLIVAEPQIMEQIVHPTKEFKFSAPKTDTIMSVLPVVGKHSLVIAEGEDWKNLRKRFNKGFQPSHLHSLNPLIVEKTRVFIQRLETLAKKGETFALKPYAQDLTTDIITQLVIEEDYRSQSTPEGEGPKSLFGVLTASRILSSLVFQVGQGVSLKAWLDPIRPAKAYVYEKVFTYQLRKTVKEKIEAERRQHPSSTSSSTMATAGKAIVQLALVGLTPTDSLIDNTVSQIKTFLFAGQDTTATAIQWICYELSKASRSSSHAQILQRLQSEHDTVFGPGVYSALSVLSKPSTNSETLLNSHLPYTTAFIREVLRLHPPAATARWIPPPDHPLAATTSSSSPSVTINIDGKETRIDGLRIYSAHWLIHRNPKTWGPTAHSFIPDRWLDESYVASLPPGAWRIFERGPRACIGQELAMMELKVVLCAVARSFEFEKIGLTGDANQKEVWNINHVTSVPCDGMVVKVRMRNEEM